MIFLVESLFFKSVFLIGGVVMVFNMSVVWVRFVIESVVYLICFGM